MSQSLSKESACKIVIECLKKKKNTDKIEITMIELEDDCRVVRGTSPLEVWRNAIA